MTHYLKTDKDVWLAVFNLEKTFEIRKNDRNFQVDDVLVLRPTRHTGAEMANGEPLEYLPQEPIHAIVIYILNGPIYGLAEGWCIMSINTLVSVEYQEPTPTAT